MTKLSFRSLTRTARLMVVVGGTAALSACATLSSEIAPMPGTLEPIHGAAFTDDLAIVRVTSNGCTTKSDLVPYLTRARDFSILTVRRLNEDQCNNPMPDGLEVQWTFEELGLPHGTAVTVNNPFRLKDVVVQGRGRSS
ncbi:MULTISPECIES: hypothetical protein [unclassified Brevundimonas]|uniref:hypothetical protein n=1 Tax=unclassified Brevundimonas TaxID=2622653 RepID=UPI0025B9D30D|nr:MULTISPECIES: hypothetical protein [unclassified Brevundimonas]